MPFFGFQPHILDELINKAISEGLIHDDQDVLSPVIKYMKKNPADIKLGIGCLRRKLCHANPNVVLTTLTLIDMCVKDCFITEKVCLEVASKDFVSDFKKVIVKSSHYKVCDRAKFLLKTWASNKSLFCENAALSLIPALYNELIREGIEFNDDKGSESQKYNLSDLQKEEEDIAKAIQLSLQSAPKNSISSSEKSSLYPSTNTALTSSGTSEKDLSSAFVTVLYDFEAVEDNELTLKVGDVIRVTDNSDPNWWRGIDFSGNEGLFPATFVSIKDTADQKAEEEKKSEECSVSSKKEKVLRFAEDEEKYREEAEDDGMSTMISSIEEDKIDACIQMLNNCDPTGQIPDPSQLEHLERDCLAMTELIDKELEKIDDTHSNLFEINQKLTDALHLYNQLMTQNSLSQFAPANNLTGSVTIPNNLNNEFLPQAQFAQVNPSFLPPVTTWNPNVNNLPAQFVSAAPNLAPDPILLTNPHSLQQVDNLSTYSTAYNPHFEQRQP